MRIPETITCINEDGIPYLVKRKTSCMVDNRHVFEQQDAVNLAHQLGIVDRGEEYLYMICLNTKNRVVSITEISHGSVNGTVCEPREVCQKALLNGAVGVIMMHNHPSGDATPSQTDLDITKKLKEAFHLIGIRFFDHLICARTEYFSIKERYPEYV